MTTTTMKITRKGQVTIPKEIRERLNADFVYFEMKGDVVLVKPVRDASGSLRDFAANVKRGASTKKKRDKAWHEAVRGKPDRKAMKRIGA